MAYDHGFVFVLENPGKREDKPPLFNLDEAKALLAKPGVTISEGLNVSKEADTTMPWVDVERWPLQAPTVRPRAHTVDRTVHGGGLHRSSRAPWWQSVFGAAG